MADTGDIQPEIKFRWCREVRCRSQVVYLVLTSVTGTQVKLNWRADLGWYESDPTPIPCGFHTGFILIRERVRDFVRDTLEIRESDYKVDPFHIVPHKFAVELFLESDEATSFWSEAPELRLRYLSSDHLEKLGSSAFETSGAEEDHNKIYPQRKWVSSTSLHTRTELGLESTSHSLRKGYREQKDDLSKHSGSLDRGKLYGQLAGSVGELKDQSKFSTSSPNLSRAFQIAVDLSRASSKFLTGVSSTSSGVFLGCEDGSKPPSPETENCIHTDSAYAAGGETSQESESGEVSKRRKKSNIFARGRSLHVDDLVGEDIWKSRRGRIKCGLTNAPSSSFEDLLGSISTSRRAAVDSEINVMRFETLERERLVKEILHSPDSDFEDEVAPCETSNPDLQGPYQCVITFESRSTSMDDVGSPRALEDVLVSLTSNDSEPETSQPKPLPRTVLQPELVSDESAIATSENEGEGRRPTPKPRTLTPVHIEVSKEGDDVQATGEEPLVTASKSVELQISSGDEEPTLENIKPPAEFEALSDDEKIPATDSDSPVEPDPFDIFFGSVATDEGSGHQEEGHRSDRLEEKDDSGFEKPGDGSGVDVIETSDPIIRISDTEDDNFQYESLKHDDHENLPIDIRDIDSEESLDNFIPKVQVENISPEVGDKDDYDGDCKTEEYEEEEERESEGGGAYEVEGAEAAYSSMDGEVPTDAVTLVPLDSYKGTVREVKDFETSKEGDITGEVLERKQFGDFSDVKGDAENIHQVRGSEFIGNEETDRSETEVLLNITEFSRKHSIESDNVEHKDKYSNGSSRIMSVVSDKSRTQSDNNGDHLKSHLSDEKSSIYIRDNGYRERSKSEHYREHSESNKHHSRSTENVCVQEPIKSSSGFRETRKVTEYKESTISNNGHSKPVIVIGTYSSRLRKQYSNSDDSRRNSQNNGVSSYFMDDQNSENHRPFIKHSKLLDMGTQTSLIKQISRTTSMDSQKLLDSDSQSSSDRFPSKYTRSPLRNRTNGQTESFVPLPDRLSGPWSHKMTPASNARSSSASPYTKPELNMMQRNLYNLVQGDEGMQMLQNSIHLQKLRSNHHGHIPRYHSPQKGFEHHSTNSRTSTSDPPLSQHSSPKRYHQYQSSDNHYHQPRLHYSPLRHEPDRTYSTPFQYKYPLLSTSVIKTSSPSRTPLASNISAGRITRAYSGSVTDLSRTSQRTQYDHASSTPIRGGSGVRPASSLPDLRQSASTSFSRQAPSASPPYAHFSSGPRHAQSASDIMVGGYGGKGKRVSWREWPVDDSDSGGSTDSLIDEAERAATTRVDLSSPGWDDRYRKRHRSRRRTRSHQEFSAWRDDSEVARYPLSSRPYLPYRGDQLSPGQQVKVLAPGGGVAVARVVTNQRSALVAKGHHHTPHGVISPAAVTVVLMTEPNRLQGTVVTIPLEKVLLAWPRV